VLARHGVVAPELCSIEEFLGRNTASYYAILGEVGEGRWNPNADARPWVRYCLAAHYVQGSLVLRRLNEWRDIWEACETLVRSSSLPVRAIVGLADATYGLRIRNATYRTRLANDEEISESGRVKRSACPGAGESLDREWHPAWNLVCGGTDPPIYPRADS
jgi:hypothetical protein